MTMFEVLDLARAERAYICHMSGSMFEAVKQSMTLCTLSYSLVDIVIVLFNGTTVRPANRQNTII